ncbi:sulfite exporter TauE/SafE family protein [Vibrio sp. S4M6]|uniref:sulfite exporter TauE/SafE family protein n=1 Tax=Vibrio sinus TaxID=2946865 RepID=UPI00202A0F7D|nr:sulfite exporter TauE/SafE family protein [Vibrio sinus]MCL9781725.1 sulfite exporter TauE/SafE family protein [Vibrio sinus]
MFTILFLFLIIGLICGIFSGMLGLGGALIAVPMMLWILPLLHIPSATLAHIAFGTSLSIVCLNGLSASYHHIRNGSLNWRISTLLAPGIGLGALLGSALGSQLNKTFLTLFLAAVIVVILVRSFRTASTKTAAHMTSHARMPNKFVAGPFSVLAGLSGSLNGGGCATYINPYLKHHGYKMDTCSAQSSLLSSIVAFIGAVTYIVAGLGAPSLPTGSVGFIYLPGALVAVVAGFPATRLGNWLRQSMSDSFAYSIFLTILAISLVTTLSSLIF